MNNILSSFLVLDYCKYKETLECLESIKQHALFPHKTVHLDNGSNVAYPSTFLNEGLCDVLISKRTGDGGGFGQTDLFRWCDTPYAYFVQNDQKLIRDITEDTNNKFIELLNNGYKCVDLNGDQSGRKVWTDRAHFIETKFFNSLAPFPNGGPGPNHHLRWNENYLQEVFSCNNFQIAHIGPLFFQDCGKLSIRKNPDGSIWEIRPDTKGVRLVNGPVRESYVFPEFTEQEWKKILDAQAWADWDIPENLKKHSFHVWN
jgi:hypothetical protein